MKWNRTELLDKLHIGSVFAFLLFAGFLFGPAFDNSPLIPHAFVVAWGGASLVG